MTNAPIPTAQGLLRTYAETTDQPGRLEGQHPMVAFIDEHDAYDKDSGNVESPTGWFALAGRWIITHDTHGFVDGTRFDTRALAATAFDELDAQYDEWANDDDEAS